jgi:TonB family protein
MIVIEFIIFVVSSGLFCSEKFRGHIWAVIAAGVIATGSSLLFVYDLGAKLAGREKEPPVITRIVRQTVVKTVQPSQPAAAANPHNCMENYPLDSLKLGEEGSTTLGFRILTDGTVDAVKVLASSGSERLDEAAVRCAANWHYRPAIKDGKLTETSWKTSVKWVLPKQDVTQLEAAAKPEEEQKAAEKAAVKTAKEEKPSEGHAWYDVGSWFGSDSDKKPAQAEKKPSL